MEEYESTNSTLYRMLTLALHKVLFNFAWNLLNCFSLLLVVGGLFTGCRNSSIEADKSPEFEYIQEYAYSPDESMMALVVSSGSYSRQTGMEHSQIIILDSETWEVLYSKEFSEFGPNNLQWFENSNLLYMLNDLGGENPRLINWDLTTNIESQQPFFHEGFTVSNSLDTLVAWGALKQQEGGEINEVIDGQLYFYCLPDVEKCDSITIHPENDLEIRHAVWSNDDKALLVLGRSNHPLALHTVYRLDLSTGEQKVEIADVSTWNSFSWNSVQNLVAFTNEFGVDIYHLGYDCYIAHLDFAHTPFIPMWDALNLTLIKDEGPTQKINRLIGINLDYLVSARESECQR